MHRSLFLILLVHLVTGLPSLDVRTAVVRTDETNKCIPRSGMLFINATLNVLARPEGPPLEGLLYQQYLGRFMSLITDRMSEGTSFCGALGSTAVAVVPEWNKNYFPRPRHEYVTHCENVMRSTPEANYFLWRGPAFENELYECLRIGMVVATPSFPDD